MSLTINALIAAATASSKAFNPIFVGLVQSYDWQEKQPDYRRIRVTYPEGDRMVVSPLLYRVVSDERDDPPMPGLQSAVLGLWLNEAKTSGLWLGVVVNRKHPPQNPVQAKDRVISGDRMVQMQSNGARVQLNQLGDLELRGRNITFQHGPKRISVEQIFDALGFTVTPPGNDFDLDD